MKTMIYSLLGCLTFAQVSYAALPALSESLAEYQVIISGIGTDPSFNNVIPPSEVITDIKRLTHELNVTGTVRYKIVTRSVSSSASANIEECSSCGGGSSNHHSHVYIAVLSISPNPGIGPFIITFQSLTQVSRHSHTVMSVQGQETNVGEELFSQE